MPVVLDVPGMFLAGSAIALSGHRRIVQTRASGESRYVRGALIFGIFYGMSMAFPAFWREDWMWSYLLRPPLPTMVWYLLYIGILCLSAWSGAVITQRALRQRFYRRAVALCLGSLLALGLSWGAFAHRYVWIGSYEEYHTDQAFHLSEMPDTGRVILIGVAINAVILVIIGVVNLALDKKDQREADGSP